MSASAPAPRRRVLRGALLALLAAIGLALLAALGAAWWLLGSTSGLETALRALNRVPGLSVEAHGVHGRLADELSLERLVIAWHGYRLEARRVRLAWRPEELIEDRLHLQRLEAEDAEFVSPDSKEPAAPPEDLRLPIAVRIDHFALGALRLRSAGQARSPAQAPGEAGVTALRFSLDSDGAHHRIHGIELVAAGLRFTGQVAIDGAAPFVLAADARIEGRIEGEQMALSARAAGPLASPSLAIEAKGERVSGTGLVALRPFAAVPVANAQIHLRGLDPSAFDKRAPAARLDVDADLTPTGETLALDALALAGPLSISNRASAPIDSGGIPVRTLAAQASWREGALDLTAIRLDTGKGRATGSARWARDRYAASLALTEVDLSVLHGSLKPTRLSGQARLEGDERAQHLVAKLSEPRFEADVDLTHEAGRVRVAGAELRSRGAAFAFSGEAELDSGIFELKGRLESFDPSLYAEVPKGRLTASLDGHGVWKQPYRGEVRFEMAPSTFADRAVKGVGRVALDGRRVWLAGVVLDIGGNTLRADGAWGAPADRLALELEAPHLERLHPTLAGRARLSAEVGGTLETPQGRLSGSARDLRIADQVRVQALTLDARLAPGASGRLEGQASAVGLILPGAEAHALTAANLRLEGTRGDHTLSLTASTKSGWTAEIDARGALQDPPAWQGELSRVQVAGAVPATLLRPAKLVLDARTFALGPAEVASLGARFVLEDTRLDAEGIRLKGRFAGLSPARLRASATAPLGPPGLTFAGSWDLTGRETLEGTVLARRESGDVVLDAESGLTLGLQDVAVRAQAAGGMLAVGWDAQGTRLGRVEGRLRARLVRTGRLFTLERDGPLAGAASAQMPDLAWLGPALDPNLQTGGALSARVEVNGTLAQPRTTGQVRGRDLSLVWLREGTRLTEGVLEIDFDPNGGRIGRLDFSAPARAQPLYREEAFKRLTATPGRLSATGDIDAAARRLTLEFRAERVPAVQRRREWLVASGAGRLRIEEGGLAISGKLSADGGHWEVPEVAAPSLSDDVIVLDGRTARQRPFRLELDLEGDLGQRFSFAGRGLDTRLAGSVRLKSEGRGTAYATGSIRTRAGTYRAYGQKLDIERGILNFQGPVDNPGLNILALRKNQAVEAGVEVTGTLRSPRVRLYSEPSVPDAEKISWLVLGRAPDKESAGDTAALISAAGALLGEQAGALPNQIVQAFGLDEISVVSGDVAGRSGRTLRSSVVSTGVDQDAGEIVTVGKRLSRSTYVAFEQSLADAETVIKVTHRLTRQLSVIARAGAENAIDLLYTFRFD